MWRVRRYHLYWKRRLTKVVFDKSHACCLFARAETQNLRKATAALASVLTQMEPLLTGRVESLHSDSCCT